MKLNAACWWVSLIDCFIAKVSLSMGLNSQQGSVWWSWLSANECCKLHALTCYHIPCFLQQHCSLLFQFLLASCIQIRLVKNPCGMISVRDNLFRCILAAGRYFDEISQDTGKYCFGVEDTLKALEMGAVEILIVYENLDIMRYVLHCQGTEGR